MNCGACDHGWEAVAMPPTGPVYCPNCEAHICVCGCGKHLGGMRADSRYFAAACRTALEREGWGTTRAARAHLAQTRARVHPLSDARAQQEESETNKRFGLLIRQAIIDLLKTKGEVHADDLEPYYPEAVRKRCRKLAPAQFGSLAFSKLIQQHEYRKSAIPERKGSKSWSWKFTKSGWDRWGTAGVSAGGSEGQPPSLGGVENASTHSGDSELDGLGGAAGVKNPQGEGKSGGDKKPAGVHSREDRADQRGRDRQVGGAGSAPSGLNEARAEAEAADATRRTADSQPARLFDDLPPSAYERLRDVA